MRRAYPLLLLAAAMSVCAGCTIISHGDELPTAEQQADADARNPFSPINRPLDRRR